MTTQINCIIVVHCERVLGDDAHEVYYSFSIARRNFVQADISHRNLLAFLSVCNL